MGLKIKDKEKLKRDIKALLSELIEVPNRDVLSVQAHYDPNLNVVTIAYTSIKDKTNSTKVWVLDEKVNDEGQDC